MLGKIFKLFSFELPEYSPCWGTEKRKKAEKAARRKPHKQLNLRVKKARKHAKERFIKWADTEAIWQVYKNCGIGMTVDHIIPLRAKLASGLHIAENLQLMPPEENVKKNNHFVPYREVGGEIVEYYT